MTPDQYHERALARLDAMRTAEKDRIILGFLAALYPRGDPDHEVSGADFIAEAIRLLTEFHPSHLASPAGETDLPPDDDDIAF